MLFFFFFAKTAHKCVTATDLKHDDKRETYGEEVEELREVFTFFISETSIPAQYNSVNNRSVTDQNKHMKGQLKQLMSAILTPASAWCSDLATGE